MITLSAPAYAGYREQFADEDEMLTKVAELLGTDDYVTRESGDGSTTYYYASDEDAAADKDGAYAVQSRAWLAEVTHV